MVIFGITGTVGALAMWMLRRVAILNVKGVGFDHRCWSNTAAEAKQKNVALTVGQQTVEFFKPCKKNIKEHVVSDRHAVIQVHNHVGSVMLKKYMT
jgi:tRNA A37 threonylcarbamoyladenosine dehydratase